VTTDSSGSGGFWPDSNIACVAHEELSGSCSFRFPADVYIPVQRCPRDMQGYADLLTGRGALWR